MNLVCNEDYFILFEVNKRGYLTSLTAGAHGTSPSPVNKRRAAPKKGTALRAIYIYYNVSVKGSCASPRPAKLRR